MSDILSGIRGLKKINSLLKARGALPHSSIEKSEKLSVAEDLKLTPDTKNTAFTRIRLNGNIFINGDKDKELINLIQKRLICEEAIHLKQEIKNFSSVFFPRLG
ncbi:MAG TPA: hypothetical protein VGB01_03185 [candidate division Zixibacteria bacterium]